MSITNCHDEKEDIGISLPLPLPIDSALSRRIRFFY